jgi:tRNA(fMet)-specific endonuclease VapC
MHLLDTDTLTYLHAGHPKVIQRLAALADREVGTTLITKIELLRGRMDFVLKAASGQELLRAQRLLFRTEELLEPLLIVPFDDEASSHFERFRAQPKLRKIGRADLVIASIVLARRAVLVTRNIRHFRQFPGIQVANWVD